MTLHTFSRSISSVAISCSGQGCPPALLRLRLPLLALDERGDDVAHGVVVPDALPGAVERDAQQVRRGGLVQHAHHAELHVAARLGGRLGLSGLCGGVLPPCFGTKSGAWPWWLTALQRLGFTSADVVACIKEANVVGMGATGRACEQGTGHDGTRRG